VRLENNCYFYTNRQLGNLHPIATVSGFFMTLPARRLEDKIRELCARTCSTTKDSLAVLSELQAAMHEYTRRVGNRTYASVLGWPDPPDDRRKSARLLTGK
jgi:hypothetical protein